MASICEIFYEKNMFLKGEELTKSPGQLYLKRKKDIVCSHIGAQLLESGSLHIVKYT